MANAATGLLIIRTWIEPGSAEPLRARIVRTLDVSLGVQHEDYSTDVEDVYRLVQRWLDEFSIN